MVDAKNSRKRTLARSPALITRAGSGPDDRTASAASDMIGRGLFVPFRDRYRQIQKPVQFPRSGRLNFNVADCQAQRAPGSTLQPGAGRRGERGPGDGGARDPEFPNEAVTSIRTVCCEGDRAYRAT